MERFIKIPKDFYDSGFDICKEDGIFFQEGVSILVGCNGTGKSTVIKCIKKELDQNNIPFIKHDNYRENNKSNIMDRALEKGQFDILSASAMSSEGENIDISLGLTLQIIRDFLINGKSNDFGNIFKYIRDDNDTNKELSKERWILFDAVDSGYSIDNIVTFKEVINIILDDSKKLGVNTFIVIAANSYEMAVDLPCIDIWTGNYIKFSSYSNYKSYILETKNRKNERLSDEK